jgi:hypothetical protein
MGFDMVISPVAADYKRKRAGSSATKSLAEIIREANLKS